MRKKNEIGGWYLADVVERSEAVGANKSNPNRRCLTWVNTLLIRAFLVASVGCSAVSPVEAGDLAPLTWLAGCWSNPQGDAGSGEYWQPLAGGSMLGVGRLIRNGKTVEYEFLRLHLDEQSRVIYTATPSRQKETSFIASQVADGIATFENRAHDFPQKIVYTKTNPASMSVRIEGERQGKPHSIEFRFERVECPN